MDVGVTQNTTGRNDSTHLPSIKKPRGLLVDREDELMKLIRRNQKAHETSMALRKKDSDKELMRVEDGGQKQELPRVDDYVEQSKEEKNELLSQYFSAKRHLKNKL